MTRYDTFTSFIITMQTKIFKRSDTMSLWYDIKKKSYASDAKGSWIKLYVDKMLTELKTKMNTRLEAHYTGEEGRHSADDVICNSGKSVETALLAESAERLSTASTIRQEISLNSAALEESIEKEKNERLFDTETLEGKICVEEASRISADNILQSNIDAEVEARQSALTLKVDKEEGKGLSANDYTDEEKNRLTQVEAETQKNAKDISSVKSRAEENKNAIANMPVKSGAGNGSAVFNSPNNIADGSHSSAQGRATKASGECAVAEGYLTIADGRFSRAQNQCTEAYGQSSHAGGLRAIVHSHTGFAHGRDVVVEEAAIQAAGFGNGTIVTTPQSFVIGSYNIADTNEDTDKQYVHIVGNGTTDKRSNAYTLDRQGNAWFAGKITFGENKDELVTKGYVDGLVSDAGGGDMLRTVYDQDNNGVVDNAEKLGGQLPSYYATKAEVDAKASMSHASPDAIYGVGNSSSYGHLKLANNLTTTTTSGIALSANQGKVLDDKITALITSLNTPPALTSVTPDGTKIGEATWTGTGWVCMTENTKYVFNDDVFTLVNGFNRFCLKPADNSAEWKNWTPFFNYDGQEYEFFFSPTRGLYEAMIPATTMTAEGVVAAIEWKNIPPTILNYGKISNMFGCYETITQNDDGTTTSDKTYFIRREGDWRDTTGRINDDDLNAQQGLSIGSYSAVEGNIDINSAALAMLSADVCMNTHISFDSMIMTSQIITGKIRYFKVDSIDNFN